MTVYRLITHETIEQAIMALHDDKRTLVANVLGGADSAGKLSTADLMALIRQGAPLAQSPASPGIPTELARSAPGEPGY